MERRSFLGALTAASLGVAFNGVVTKFARAQNIAQRATNSQASKMGGFPQNSTVILVHGAWADGSCWRNVILPLERHGLHVICAPIPLTSSGRPHLAPLIEVPSERLASISVKAMISVLPSFQLQRPNRPISSLKACSRLMT